MGPTKTAPLREEPPLMVLDVEKGADVWEEPRRWEMTPISLVVM